MTAPARDPFAGSSDRNPAWSWKDVPVGTAYDFVLTAGPGVAQARDFDSRELLFWDPARKGKKTTTPNGQPVENAVIEATVNGEPVALFVTIRGESLFFAIQTAQNERGQTLAPGGTLRITLTGRVTDPDNPHRQPRKEFTASYTPPSAFGPVAGTPEPAAHATWAPTPAAPTPAAPTPAAPAPAAPAPAAPATPAAPAAPAASGKKGVSASQYAAMVNAGIDVSGFEISA